MLSFFSRVLTRRARRNERGAVLIIGVITCLMAVSFCALGIDIGRIAVDKKTDQKVADLAALDAARAIGFILNTTDQAGYDTAAQTAANASAVRNGFTANGTTFKLTALTGSISGANAFIHDATASAVQVVVQSRVKNQFVTGNHDNSATAVAFVGSPIAAFSVGSTLASLDTSKSRLDPMLKTMFGATGSFSLVSYDGLAAANLSLGYLQTALLGAGVNVGSVDQLLNTDIKVQDLLHAMATALTAQGNATAAARVNDIPIATIPSLKTVKLGDLLNVATPSDSAVLTGKFNVYQLISGTAELMNGSNFVSVPLTGINLGALGGVSLAAKVIEPARTAIGPVGTTADNAQVALQVGVDVGLGLLLPLVHVTLVYTAASAHGLLTSIVCGASPTIGITAGTAAVGVTGTATVALAGTLNINGSIAGTPPTALPTFSKNAVPTQFAPTFTRHIGAATTGIALGSVQVTGTGLAYLTLGGLLQAALPGVLSTLDSVLSPVIKPLLAGLGLNLSAADVAALGIFPDPASCGGRPRLAQ